MPDSTVGIDISKTHLDAYMAPAGKAARFTNDAAGFDALIAWIDQPVRSVVYEPTGPWHRAFEEALLRAGLPLARANPLQARRFAQAMGQRAKTDAVDARVLAQMGTALPLRPTEASSPTRRALEELQMARDALVTDRTAARNRQKHLRHRQQSKTRLSQIDRHLAAVDAEIGKRLAEDVVLARRTEILTSIPGVSSITAAGLLTRMPELGRLDAKAVASLAGLAPVTRQSGAWQGRSFIRGGRPRVRRLLYMPALAAIRCNPDLRAKYRQLRGQEKPPKVALTAVMRKLLLLANALLEQNRSWLPDRPGRGSAAAPAGASAPPRRRMTSPWAPRLAGGFRAAGDQAKCTSVCGRARSAVAERATTAGTCPSVTTRGAVRGSTAAGRIVVGARACNACSGTARCAVVTSAALACWLTTSMSMTVRILGVRHRE